MTKPVHLELLGKGVQEPTLVLEGVGVLVEHVEFVHPVCLVAGVQHERREVVDVVGEMLGVLDQVGSVLSVCEVVVAQIGACDEHVVVKHVQLHVLHSEDLFERPSCPFRNRGVVEKSYPQEGVFGVFVHKSLHHVL